MFGPRAAPIAAKPPMSGPEILLRSLGLGEILDTIQRLASDGTLGKFAAFANDGTIERAKRVLDLLEGYDERLRAIEYRIAPGSGSYNGGPLDGGDGKSASVEHGTVRQPGARRAPIGDVDGDGAADIRATGTGQ